MAIIQRFTEGTVFKLLPGAETEEELLLRIESRSSDKLDLTNLLQGGSTLSRSIDEIELSLAEGRVEFVISSPVGIPAHSATHSGNIRPPIPVYPATPLRSAATHRIAA